MRAVKRAIGPVLLLLAIAALWASGITHQITLENIQAHGDQMRAAITAHPVRSAAIFTALYAGMVISCLPMASIFSLLGGFLFGGLLGGVLIIAAAGSGSAILFVVARSSAGSALRARAGGLYAKIATQMEKDAVSYLLFMRLVPVFPAVVTAVIPALFHIRPWTFLWTTVLGMAPAAFIYAFLGQKLGDIRQISDLFSPGLLAALCALGLLALTPILMKKVKANAAGKA